MSSSNTSATALELALKNDSIPLSKRLQMAEEARPRMADVNVKDDEWGDTLNIVDPNSGFTPLMMAAMHGNVNTVRVLLSRGANIDFQDEMFGKSALQLAAKNGHVDTVEELLHRGARINIADIKGMTPLLYSSRNGHFNIVVTLIKYGANINTPDVNNWSAVHYAAKNGHKDITFYLAKSGAILSNKESLDGKTPLMLAAQYGRPETVSVLLENGVNVKTVSTNDHVTALILAAKEGHKGVVSILVNAGADLDALDRFAWSALHYTASWGRRETTSILIDGGADVNLMGYTPDDEGGTTPLIIATKNSQLEVMKVMISRGVAIDINDLKEKKSALMYACELGLTSSASCLIEYGAQVNTRDGEFGITPLMFAALSGHEEIMSMLLGKFADMNMCDLSGLTAYDHALSSGKLEPFFRSVIKSSGQSKANIAPWIEMIVPKMVRSKASAGANVFLTTILYDSKNGLYRGLFSREASQDVYLLFTLVMLYSAINNCIKKKEHFIDIPLLTTKLKEVDKMIDICLKAKILCDDRYIAAVFLMQTNAMEEAAKNYNIRDFAGALVSGPLGLSIENEISSVMKCTKLMTILKELFWSCLRPTAPLTNGIGARSPLIRIRYVPAAMFIGDFMSKILVLAFVILVSRYNSDSLSSQSSFDVSGFNLYQLILAILLFAMISYEYGLVEEKRWTPSCSLIYDLNELEATRLAKVFSHFFTDVWKIFDLLTIVCLALWFIFQLMNNMNISLNTTLTTSSTLSQIFVSLAAIPLSLGMLRYPAILNETFGHLIVFIFQMTGILWRFIGLFAFTGLGFGIAFMGIFASTITEFSSISTTFSLLFDSIFRNLELTIFDNSSQPGLGKFLLAFFVIWTVAILLSSIVGNIVVEFNDLKEVSRNKWALMFMKTLQQHSLVFEKSACCMLPVPFNLITTAVHIPHVLIIWRARLTSSRKLAVSLAGLISDKLLAIVFLVPAAIHEYSVYLFDKDINLGFRCLTLVFFPLTLLFFILSYALHSFGYFNEVILKSRIRDGRVRVFFGGRYDFPEAIGFRDDLTVTLEKLKNWRPGYDKAKEDANNTLLITKRNMADAKVSSSFRVNTTFGGDIRISPTISAWDNQDNNAHLPGFNDFTESKMEDVDGGSTSEVGPNLGSKYLLPNSTSNFAGSSLDEPSLDRTLVEERSLVSQDLSQPYLKNKTASPLLQASMLFPPAAVGAIFDETEKKSIFKGILPDCSLTEAEEILMVTVTHLEQFKQQFSDRLSEVERRQDVEIDILYALKNGLLEKRKSAI